MASFEDKFRELEHFFEKWSAKIDTQLLASSSQGSDSPGIRSKVGYDDRTLLVRIHLEEYSVSWEVLNQVFSKIGYVEYIEVFSPDSQFHSQVRFQDRESAVKAVERYDGRCIYDGCCIMELALEVPTSHPSSSIVAPIEDSTPEIVTSKIEHVQEESFVDEYKLFDEMPMEDESEILQENFDAQMNAVVGQTGTEFHDRPNNKEIVVDSLKVEDFVDELEKADFGPIKEELKRNTEAKQSTKEVDGNSSSLHIQYEPSRNDLKNPMIPEIIEEIWKVNSHPLKVLAVEVKDTSEVAANSIAPMGIRGTDLEINSIEFLKSPIAQDLFVEMPEPCVFQVELTKCSNVIESPLIVDVMVHEHRLWVENLVFGPGIVDRHDLIHRDFTLFVLVSIGKEAYVILLSQNRSNWVFDPGGAFALFASEPKLMSNGVEATMVAEVPSIRKLLFFF